MSEADSPPCPHSVTGQRDTRTGPSDHAAGICCQPPSLYSRATLRQPRDSERPPPLEAREAGLLVLPTLPNVQFTVRVNALLNETFTLEAATNLNFPIPWTPLVTPNVPAMPFDYVDFDVKLSEKPQKFYRVRQP